MTDDQKVTVGRIVHYQAHSQNVDNPGPEARAAIVTKIHENGNLGLCVLHPGGMTFTRGTRYSATPKPGHWNWPPRS